MELESLNTVHGLTEEIRRLRAGSESGGTPEARSTPGQLWGRLLELGEVRRIEMLRSLLESADEGARCSMDAHQANLEFGDLRMEELAKELEEWKMSRRLLTVFIRALRQNQMLEVEQGTVADKLELFMAGGDGPARRIVCDYAWMEAGTQVHCAEPVGSSGYHLGDHHAYVAEGSSADLELRMKYLEEENDALRSRLGLAPNRRRR